LIGDTLHDGIAAEANKIDFAIVEYGYGEYANSNYKFNIINQLLNIL
jgi:phosphoglycolate phosphatase-like HAD superfamily hydrolase